MQDMVLILSYDSACTRAVAQALRAEKFCCRLVSASVSAAEVEALQPRGLILAGGESGGIPAGVDPGLLNGRWPVLALGDAAAMLCRQMGGDAMETVFSGGIGTVSFVPCSLTEGIESCERVLRSVRRLRLHDDLRPLCACQQETIGVMHAVLPLYGLQFSLEPNDTDGLRLLLNFATRICGCTRWWSADVCIEDAVSSLRRMAEGGRAVCAITGGLNSGVTAVLAHRALGDQLQCVFIDTGLMRENESSLTLGYYRDQLGISVTPIQAGDRFLSALAGVIDPAEKDRAVAMELQKVLDETLPRLGDFKLILRSTTAADLLRGLDASKRPGLRGAAPLAEPLRELFKPEVQQIGDRLGMPEELIRRPSFPGSGLALRIQGEVNPARLQTLRACEYIFTDEIQASGLERRLRQRFAVLYPMPGDGLQSVIVLRAVQNGDAFPAHPARLPYDLLERATERILRQRPEVRRVVYDLTPSIHSAQEAWQ